MTGGKGTEAPTGPHRPEAGRSPCLRVARFNQLDPRSVQRQAWEKVGFLDSLHSLSRIERRAFPVCAGYGSAEEPARRSGVKRGEGQGRSHETKS
ncbi:MAG: hypothetical protein FD177_484 [Desulfovibrionaceae bacterium]|nr:MAG: hypothetical protein FD177_484 [Desulfovibrionaceae bacterium]